jgi:two-component system invasion response regulator UvrY
MSDESHKMIDEHSRQLWERLTPRQREVAEAIALGHDRTTIASKLGVSGKTVDTFRMQVMRRLNTKNNVELARLAIAENVVEVPTTDTWRAPS